MSLPNLITMARILCVPLIVWAITSGQMLVAFVLFMLAGLSDAVDGFLAKRFNMSTELGAMLDPVADKALIVSIYVALGFTEALPRWLVILVVSRDILIVGGFLVAKMINRPMPVRPHPVSKLNTVAQILLAGLALGALALRFDAGSALPVLIGLVTILTLLSIAFYVAEWIRHFGTNGAAR
ncbi:CDP-alcohol phosphatidyltransferase family protein [Pseudorhodoplanes sp.]|uniref:CDP-alcohol phosphatidyltransferase family protein n=1 Tax=Pseudorhodoplanes sp. TaxID=1934341 RepID=UPI00391BF209